jgi:hypothetical protein
MFTAKISHVPADGPLDSTSYFGSVRRYFGEAGRSYVGLKYGHGLSREETRNASDLIDLDSDTLGAELSYESAAGWLVSLSAGSSRQERVFGDVLWQHTFGTSLGLRF